MKYKESLEEVLVNLRCIDVTGNEQVDSYIDDSIKIITNALEGENVKKLIPEEVKKKVYKVVQDVFKEYGNIETEKVITVLKEDHGVCFFNTFELEKLIKKELDKQIFAYC